VSTPPRFPTLPLEDRSEHRIGQAVDLIKPRDRWVEVELGETRILELLGRLAHLHHRSLSVLRDLGRVVADDAVVVEKIAARGLLGILA